MGKIKITFIEDLHGVKEFYSWQIKRIEVTNPQVIFLEMLPYDQEFIDSCNKLTKGIIKVETFKKATRWEEIWGTFEGYDDLFLYLQRKHLPVYPIDHSLHERNKLSSLEKSIIAKHRLGKKVEDSIDKSRVTLFLDREAAFVGNILKYIRKNNVDEAVVIIGKNHINRLVDFFNFLDELDVEAIYYPEDERSRLYPKFKKVHLTFAKERGIEQMKYPPLVPINVLRYSLVISSRN